MAVSCNNYFPVLINIFPPSASTLPRCNVIVDDQTTLFKRQNDVVCLLGVCIDTTSKQRIKCASNLGC